MEAQFKRIKNYNVSVKEVDNKVIFLRKLERGGSAHSFGIHVAKMAGMPKSIVKRADEILHQLEAENRQEGISAKGQPSNRLHPTEYSSVSSSWMTPYSARSGMKF